MTRTFRVGILGATGTVGQRFIQLLENHPQFEITALAASGRSEGKLYADACAWRLPGALPASIASLEVHAVRPPLDCDLIFSSLPSGAAREAEDEFARAGYPVISNSSAFRMEEDVPLVIPEVNPEHLGLIDRQRVRRGYDRGFIVTNPNCSTIMVALALAPLDARYGVEAAVITTMQALSGAGYPGVPSLDIADNVLPFIESEEEKIESETRKILGRITNERIETAPLRISAQCHRVNVTEGHMAAVRVRLAGSPPLAEVKDTLRAFRSPFREVALLSAPAQPVIVRDEADRPQPRLDRDAGGGMSVTIGRVYADPVLGYRFVTLSHNTIRGAAGAAILNAELLIATGYLRRPGDAS